MAAYFWEITVLFELSTYVSHTLLSHVLRVHITKWRKLRIQLAVSRKISFYALMVLFCLANKC